MDRDHKPVAFLRGRNFLHSLSQVLPLVGSLPGELRSGEPLSLHTTMQVGGPADGFFVPVSTGSLSEAIHLCQKYETPYFVLGNGSNILFSDAGFRGLIISTAHLTECCMRGECLWAECGISLATLIQEANVRGNHSLDFLSGIPGSLGGALAMNAGTRERSIGEIVSEVTVLTDNHAVDSINREACGFSYRRSALLSSRHPVLGASLLLTEDSFDRERLMMRRAATQPIGSPSAGCIFKNPPGRSAGEIIESIGLKGLRVGNAMISEKHANFIINIGGADSAEIRRIIDIVRQKVYKSVHILLDLEIEVVDG